MTPRFQALLLFVLPTASASILYAGLFVEAHRHPQGASGSEELALIVVAALPTLIGMVLSLAADAPVRQRWAVMLGVLLMTGFALVTGAVIIFVAAAVHCPPHAYECPI